MYDVLLMILHTSSLSQKLSSHVFYKSICAAIVACPRAPSILQYILSSNFALTNMDSHDSSIVVLKTIKMTSTHYNCSIEKARKLVTPNIF